MTRAKKRKRILRRKNCGHCLGSGYLFDEKCPHCWGAGYEYEYIKRIDKNGKPYLVGYGGRVIYEKERDQP